MNAIFHLYIKKSPSAFAKIELLKLNLIFKNELLIEEQVNIKKNEDLFMHALKLAQRHFYHHPKEGIYQSDEELEVFYNHTMKSYSQYNPSFLSGSKLEVDFQFTDLLNVFIVLVPTIGKYNDLIEVQNLLRFVSNRQYDNKLVNIQQSFGERFDPFTVDQYQDFIITLKRDDFLMMLMNAKEDFHNQSIGSKSVLLYGVERSVLANIYEPISETFKRIFKMINTTQHQYEQEYLHFFF